MGVKTCSEIFSDILAKFVLCMLLMIKVEEKQNCLFIEFMSYILPCG